MIEVEQSKVDRLVGSLRSRFQLDLFGVDVIIENNTGRYGVIDLNPFPGDDDDDDDDDGDGDEEDGDDNYS